MLKLNSATRYLLASSLATLVLGVLGYWILSPVEWRPRLLHLLSSSFAAFGGADLHHWLVSHVYAPTFMLLMIVALVGILRGVPAMRLLWVQTSGIALLALFLQIVGFYGFLYLRSVVRIVYQERQSQLSANSRLEKEISRLKEELNGAKTKSPHAANRAKPFTEVPEKSASQIGKLARICASDVLDFHEERLRNLPTMLIGGAADLSRKGMEDSQRYDRQAIIDFLKTFGGPIESILRQVKAFGVDTSQLQRHMAELNNIQMIRLIADDLNDVAGQLSQGNLRSPRKSLCPSYYVSCP
jgi:hypothetical protein